MSGTLQRIVQYGMQMWRFQRSLRVHMGNISHYWKNDWLAGMRDMRDSDLLGNSVAVSPVASSKSAAR